MWGGVYDPKSFLFFPYPALPPNVVRRPHIRGARTTDAIMVERKVDPRRGIFQRGGNCQRASVDVILHVAAAWGRLAGRLGGSWAILAASRGALAAPWAHLGASGRHRVGALGPWRCELDRKGRILDRGGRLEPWREGGENEGWAGRGESPTGVACFSASTE